MDLVAKRCEGSFGASTFSHADTSPILPVAYTDIALGTRAIVEKEMRSNTHAVSDQGVFLGLR